VTPSASAGGSVVRKPLGSMWSRQARSISATPSRPSTVLMFQVNDTRSRQKQSVANIPAAFSASRARSADSKSASHAFTLACGLASSAVLSVAGSVVWVMRLLPWCL
jgi:hypothetical protein